MGKADTELAKALTASGKIVLRDGNTPANRSQLTAVKAGIRGAQAALAEGTTPPPPPLPTPDIFLGAGPADFPVGGGREKMQPPGSCVLVPAPDGSGDQVWQMSVDNNRKGANGQWSKSDNPRAQLLSPGLTDEQLKAGIWWGGAFWLPTTFPDSVPGFFNLAEFYGFPYDGPPTVELDLRHGNIGWQRNGEGGWKDIWRQPYVRGKKHTFLMHITDGLVEMWLNGKKECSEAIKVVGAANKLGPQECVIQSYREFVTDPKSPTAGIVTFFQWPMRVATTRALAEYPLPG